MRGLSGTNHEDREEKEGAAQREISPISEQHGGYNL